MEWPKKSDASFVSPCETLTGIRSTSVRESSTSTYTVPASAVTKSEMKQSNPKDAIGSDKVPLHLWPPIVSAAGAMALLDGMLKYGRANWRDVGVRSSIYYDALQRHMNKWWEGTDIDHVEPTNPDVPGGSGLPHLWHALACIAILIDAEASGKLTDDRNYNGDHYAPAIDRMMHEVKRLKQTHAGKHPHHFTIKDAPADE
jgi:hypothetical protein